MTSSGVKLTGSWLAFRSALDGKKFQRRLDRAMALATKANAMLVVDAIRHNIKSGAFASARVPNASLTIEIKRKRKPLIDSGGLIKAAMYEVQSPYRAEVGYLRGAPKTDIAIINHEGATIPVTDRMRKMFAALAVASSTGSTLGPGGLMGRAAELFARKPGGWKPLRPSTVAIRIPARPFVKEVIDNDALQQAVAENYLKAESMAIADLPVSMKDFRKKW